jgi:hypothetical protein
MSGLPITYRDFYDIPRAFALQREGDLYLRLARSTARWMSILTTLPFIVCLGRPPLRWKQVPGR